MNRLENRLNYSTWNEDNNLIIPKEKTEEYRAWYNANAESFKELGFTDVEMFQYFSNCLKENRMYSIQEMIR